MWTTLSVSRWICLLALAVVMLSSVSEVESTSLPVPCSCDRNFSSRKIHIIKSCYEQIQRPSCNRAFLIINKKGRWCIKPDTPWLKEMIETGKLHCPPDLSF